MKKFTIAILPLVMASGFANAAEPATPQTVAGGTVNFTGSIVNTPCAVDVDSTNQTVTLGQYRQSSFKQTGDTSAPVNFSIGLVDCSVDVYKSAAITFKGQTMDGKQDVLALNGGSASEQTAEGVGIQILQNSTPVTVDGSTPAGTTALLEGANNIAFQARYISTAETVSAGAADSMAEFTITYQ